MRRHAQPSMHFTLPRLLRAELTKARPASASTTIRIITAPMCATPTAISCVSCVTARSRQLETLSELARALDGDEAVAASRTRILAARRYRAGDVVTLDLAERFCLHEGLRLAVGG